MNLDSVLLLEAVHFAAEKHKSQRRKDAEATPYINHPIGVARILAYEGGITDIAILQAALLHDTVEDTETSIDELDGKFGATVARIVQEVTDDKMLPKQERKQQQILKAPLCSHQAKLVKLADKLYNLRDLNRSTPVGKLNWKSIRGTMKVTECFSIYNVCFVFLFFFFCFLLGVQRSSLLLNMHLTIAHK
uniref:Guanosine-3',5'-bis(diphosphate) 3'-pyrophosphohydrolase MESH1 n=1 Tax=Erpetoichthys calabaricus TaxID=27687 RepID=A0A8C4T0R4_ERPCA